MRKRFIKIQCNCIDVKIKLRTSTECETHLAALDMINSRYETDQSSRFMGSCVLKAPAVECRSIPAIDTRPTYRSSVVDTRSTCRSSVDRQSIDMSIDTWSTLDRKGSIVGRVATDSCVGQQHPYRDGQSADRLSTLGRYSIDARLTFISFQPLYLFILIVNYCISQFYKPLLAGPFCKLRILVFPPYGLARFVFQP